MIPLTEVRARDLMRSQVVTLRALPMRCWLTDPMEGLSSRQGRSGPWIATGRPWLADFGIARFVDATRVTATGADDGDRRRE